jgi:hypothetical protein
VTPSLASYFCHDTLLGFDVSSRGEHESQAIPPKSSRAECIGVIRGAPQQATAGLVADALSWCGVSVEQMMPSEGPLDGGVAVVLFSTENDMQTCFALSVSKGLCIYDACGCRWPLSCEPASGLTAQQAPVKKGIYNMTDGYKEASLSNCIPAWSPPWPRASNLWDEPHYVHEPQSLSLFAGLQQHVPGDQLKLPDAQMLQRSVSDNGSDATDNSTRTPDSKQEILDNDSLTGSPSTRRGGRWKSAGWGTNLAERYGCKDDAAPTTMMIRNVPCRFRQQELLNIIDGMGFERTYDFFYLPMDSRKNANLGYAFINFREPEAAARCQASLDKYMFKTTNSSKACIVKAADIQGIYNNLKHYRKSILNPSSVQKPFYVLPKGFHWSMLDDQ